MTNVFDFNNKKELLIEDRILHTYYTITNQIDEEYSVSPSLDVCNYFEIDLIVEGSGTHCINEKTFPCKENDIYILSTNTTHRYFSTNESKPITVRRLTFSIDDWFKGAAVLKGNKHYCYGAFENDSPIAYAMLNNTVKEKIDAIFDSIETELMDKDNEWKSMVRAYLIQLFSLVGRYVRSSIKNDIRKTKYQNLIDSTLKIVNNEFSNQELSLDFIAKRVFVSSSQLSRNFKEHVGQLFSEYLRETRLKYSAKLLKESDMTVERIVVECGLRNLPSFYRNFREYYGMTPQIYRQISKISIEEINNKGDYKKMEIINEISTCVQNGKIKVIKEIVQNAIDANANAEEILKDGLLSGMSIVGEKFKNNEVYVPQVLISAKAMTLGLEVLQPLLVSKNVKPIGKVCVGTVQGDLHDIGKNLVKMMMQGKGLEVVDLGTDVSPETFIKSAIDNDCQVICCSALLTTTMPVMAEIVKEAEKAGIRDKVKIMIGGAPVNQEFCDSIGADCYTPDAASASDVAVEFCKLLKTV